MLIKKLIPITFLSMIAGLTLLFPAQAIAADITITRPVSRLIIPESKDFATRKFADPWDMNRYTDLAYGQYMHDVVDTKFSGGIFSARTTGGDPNVQALFAGYDRVQYWGRDGYINRIPSKTFNRFSVRLYSSKASTAQILWFYNQFWTDYAQATWRVKPGWHTYIVDPTRSGKWQGKPLGLRLDPTIVSGAVFKIDWMRLYRQTSRRTALAWTDSDPRGSTEIYLDNDLDPANNNTELIATVKSQSNNSYSWDPSPYAPGNYYFYVKKSGQPGVYSSRIVINQTPLTRIIEPDEKGGEDYATAVSGDPWDMNQRSDVWYWDNFKDVRFEKGVMSGTAANGDARIHLRVPAPINTNKYHRLTFRYRYEGPFDYGAGTMVRVIWSPDHNKLDLFQTINDIVAYPTWETYTIDLKKADIEVGSIGWNGMMNDFRFDPMEYLANRRVYIDHIKIRADDAADKTFAIKWRDARARSRPTKVSLYYDNNRSGYNGTLIAAGVAQTEGKNRYIWNTSRVPAGAYYIYLVARDGVSTARQYSSGPLQIKH